MRFDCIVVGKGLIGSAAVKYLSRELGSVAILGPDEPHYWKTHSGVFSSHYDSGRITRILDSDPIWADLARLSILRYREIEKESGIDFFSNVGCLKIAPHDTEGRAYINAHAEVGRQLGVKFRDLPEQELQEIFPFLKFPEGSISLYEEGTAGWINPRQLIDAQLALAQKSGARVIRETATGTESCDNSTIKINTTNGDYLAEKILVAAGAFTNFNNLLSSPLKMEARGETVVLAEISTRTAELLQNMPSIVWPVEREFACRHVYIVPPARFPDGKLYIKIGAQANETQFIEDMQSAVEWFHTDGDQAVAREERSVLEDLLPSIEFLSWQSKPCILADTSTTYPFLRAVQNGVFVAAGGNGYAAKSSDELGRMGADAVLGRDIEPRLLAMQHAIIQS